MTLVYQDDFNRADSSTLGGNWTEVGSDWAIRSNRLTSLTGGAFNNLAINTTNVGSADYEVEVKFYGNANLRVIGRTSDASNYYYGRWQPGNTGFEIGVGKVIAGVNTQLATASQALTDGDTLKLSMQGTTIKVYHNGVEKLSVTDSALSAEGDQGVWTGGNTWPSISWDDFAVYDFGAGATAIPAFTHNYRRRRAA